MNASKKFYALSDMVTGDYPARRTGGYPNSKEVIFFSSPKERDEWLEKTNLLTARPLTRSEALKYSAFNLNRDRMVRPVERKGEEFSNGYVIIRKSRVRY